MGQFFIFYKKNNKWAVDILPSDDWPWAPLRRGHALLWSGMTKHDLAAFAAALPPRVPNSPVVEGEWSILPEDELASHDFNREIVPPGQAPGYPEGAVLIRCDWDFWIVATLPPAFVALDCRSIVETLWPRIDATTYPDAGDPWWDATADPEAEVPGQPFELWCSMDEAGAPDPRERMGFYATREEAVAAEAATLWSVPAGVPVLVELREWRDGVRHRGVPHEPTNVRRET